MEDTLNRLKNLPSMKILYSLKTLFGFLVFIVAVINIATGQDSLRYQQKPVFVQASLLYDFPEATGFTAGVSRTFASVIKTSTLKNGHVKSRQKDYFLSATGGFYRYPLNYTGVILIPSVGVRRVTNFYYYEFAAGLGILRTFYDGKSYEVDALGNIKELSNFGRYFATANISYALGWQLRKPALQNFAIQFKPQLWFQFPYNSFVKPHVSIEAGIRYHFSNVSISTRVRTKQQNK